MRPTPDTPMPSLPVPFDPAAGAMLRSDHGPDDRLSPAINVRRVLAMLRRRWWMPLLGAAVAGGATWAWLRAQPVRWTGSAVVQLFESRRLLGAGLGGPDAGGRPLDVAVMSQVAIVRSRGVLGAVVDSVPVGLRLVTGELPGALVRVDSAPHGGLAGGRSALEFAPEGWRVAGTTGAAVPWGVPGALGELRVAITRRPPRLDGAEVTVRDRESAIDLLAKSLVVAPREKTSLLDIRVAAPDPRLAVTLANAVAREYQRTDARVAQQQVRRRRDFVEEQLRETNIQLARAEAAQSSFRGRTQAYSAQEKFAGKRAELAAVEARRQDLETERRLTSDLLGRLEQGDPRAIRMLPSTPLGATSAVGALYQQLVAREAQRAELVSGPRGLATSSPEVQRLDTLVAGARAQLVGAVQAHLEVLNARVAALDEQRTRGEDQLRAVPVTQAEETQLAQGVEVLREQAAQLRAELQKTRIAEAAEPGQVEIIDSATRAVPLVPPMERALVFAVLLGLVAGTAAVLALDAADASVRSREDVEGSLRLRLLGTVPRIVPPPPPRAPGASLVRRPAARRPGRREIALAAGHDLRSASAESFRQLRTNLLYAASRQPARTLMVTSAREDEGKTSIVISLAISFAQQRLAVLLVDCDFVKSRLAEVLEVSDAVGLRQVLLEEVTPMAAVQATRLPNVSVVVPGASATEPLDTAGARGLQSVFDTYAAHFDVVLVDSPPVLAVADALAVGSATDAVLLVTRAGRTRRAEAAEAIRNLDSVGARVMGAVLNDPDDHLQRLGGTTYAYGYAYAAPARRRTA